MTKITAILLTGCRTTWCINIEIDTQAEAWHTWLRKKQFLIFASCANGFSLEDETLKGGVFTHWLIQGLNGQANENNDEWVNAVELEKFLRTKVTIVTNGKQTPKAVLTIDDRTPLAKVR